MAARRGRSWASALGDVALTVAAVLGTICIALVIAAAFFDVRIILFSTGSMSPTIPAGSAAIVRQIPAADVNVGDVITIERPGRLPITHRATSVAEIPEATTDARRITMRGDANAVDDPAPYDVTHVRLVVFSVPGIAPAVAALGNPWVLGAMTLGATTLVVWVFWPRRRRGSDERGDHDDRGGADGDAPGTGVRERRRARTGAGAGLALLLAAGASLTAPAPMAHAASDERVVQGNVIRLVSIDSAQMSALVPGTSAVWQVGVMADAETPGTITVQLSSTGDAVLELRYDVQACAVRWVDDACAAASTVVVEQPVPLDGVGRDILSMPSDEQRWLRILATRPENADPEASGAVDITVRATGLGDDVSTSPGGSLPVTGTSVPWLLAALAVLLLAAGAGVALHARRQP